MQTDGSRRLADWMRERGVSQAALAAQLGLVQSSVSLWLRCVARPEAHHRTALAVIAGIPEASWLTDAEREKLERIVGESAS